MINVNRGVVKFFYPDKSWGFIRPYYGGRDVHFHTSEFSGLSEINHGELGLELARDATLSEFHIPKRDEILIYVPRDRPDRGPSADHWLFPDTLVKAEKMLSTRPGSPHNFFARVMRFEPGETTHPSVFWKGTYEELQNKLEQGFPEMFDDCFTLEKLEINGKWCAMWHPQSWHPEYKRDA